MEFSRIFVNRRAHEIGVRMALGAQAGAVIRLVLGQTLRPVGVGLLFGALSRQSARAVSSKVSWWASSRAIGIAAALALGRIVASLLYGITPYDPGTLLAVALLLTAIAVLATYLPARRAARVDSMLALRAE